MSRSRADDAPHGFENIIERSNNGRSSTFLRCTKMAFDPLSKKSIQCSYKIRKDHYKNKDHKCIFLNLEQFIKKKENLISKNSNELFLKVFFLIGKQNLSISTATSHDFYNLLQEFYEFGQLNPKKE